MRYSIDCSVYFMMNEMVGDLSFKILILLLQVNYAMFFQLPMILTSHFSQSTANTISALYSIGMMPGGVACGWLSDLYGGRRACVIATFMLTLCPLLLLLALYMDNMPASLLLILLAVMGCMVLWPVAVCCSASPSVVLGRGGGG